MIESLTLFLPQLAQLSTGGVGGFLAGYAIKKIIKLILFFLGLGSLFMLYFSEKGILSINYEKLVDTISSSIPTITHFLSTIVAFLPLASSFAAGFALGIWKG